MMRIITGTARGIKLTTLEGETTRPTAERVKEAVFSMIQFEIEGRAVLDLFAGSGQLALEALSRGAARATIIDACLIGAAFPVRIMRPLSGAPPIANSTISCSWIRLTPLDWCRRRCASWPREICMLPVR